MPINPSLQARDLVLAHQPQDLSPDKVSLYTCPSLKARVNPHSSINLQYFFKKKLRK